MDVAKYMDDVEADTRLSKSVENRDQEQKSVGRITFQVFALVVFLVSWVVNGEMLQGITTGSFGFEAYNKPVFITWFSYNFMMISWIPPYLHWTNEKGGFQQYLTHKWVGKLGTTKCIAGCTFISYMLQLLNILMILGLQCISVSLSNGVYQLQTVFTVFLSVTIFRDKLVAVEILGIAVALVGISLIVVPPIMGDDGTTSSAISCPWGKSHIVTGVVSTMLSAAIGGAYLVSWRAFDEARYSSRLGPFEGLMDTQVSLAMIGTCNFLFGWPMVVFAHWSGWEVFVWPSSPFWLCLNGIIEYVFDASCALAIYLTSPVTVAILSPLTIPMSIFVDQRLFSAAVPSQASSGLGVVAVMLGVFLLEQKPNLEWKLGPFHSYLRRRFLWLGYRAKDGISTSDSSKSG